MAEEQNRPNPDELLAQVKVEEAREKRGKLKIFLGYAPGVGKTYAMLEAARFRKKDTDVVAACVETHGRAETEALLQGLEVIPRRKTEYRGIKLAEMDLDAVLKRHPQLALVDELAHENAPNSRHSKRYQDVEELLEAGTDVYTTLNVQHIESGRNVVAQITGIWVRETVPDSVVDSATEIELVDLPPDELIKRLKEGKVYVPEQIALATEEYFRKGNLIALRELTMRTAARHVEEQSQEYLKMHSIPGPWPSGERVLLLIFPGSWGTRLVRSARRLAFELGAEWTALYIETPGSARISSQVQDRITESLSLAQRLGAKAVTIQRDSIASGAVEYAKKNNVTKIVLGKPTRGIWQILTGGFLINQIIRQSEDIDVHLVKGDRGSLNRERPASTTTRFQWRSYLLAFALVGLATLLGKLLPEFLTPANLIMVYLLCVVITALFAGFVPSILVSILSVLLFDFLFISPFFTFTVSDTRYILTFIVLLSVGLVISYLIRRIRQHTEIIAARERQTTALYALGRDLAISSSLDTYINSIIRRFKETLGRDIIIFLPDPANRSSLKPYSERQDINVSDNEMATAIWSFQHQVITGQGTDTLPNATARYVPLVTARGTIGVLALSMNDSARTLNLEQEQLLYAYADLAAVAIESIQLGEQAHNAQILSQVLRDTEKLQTALLNSISHDLRTPLVSIIGALSSIQDEGIHLDNEARNNVLQVAREEAERLNRIIGNLLDLSRLEAGALRINRQPSNVMDLVGSAVDQLGSRGHERPIHIDVDEGLPYVSVDFSLIVQSIVNILDNALKYSPAGTPIEIKANRENYEIRIAVFDQGPGIPEQDLEHIFDKFYRIQRPDKVTGTGLGLSICKGIVEAHGGHIVAKNREGSGTVISLFLPIEQVHHNTKVKPNV
jgi:two-component system sensor histidine kinase KdpD